MKIFKRDWNSRMRWWVVGSTKKYLKAFFIILFKHWLKLPLLRIMPTFTKIIYLAGKCITVGKYFHTKLGGATVVVVGKAWNETKRNQTRESILFVRFVYLPNILLDGRIQQNSPSHTTQLKISVYIVHI